jgi:flagellar biosynthesis protein FlhB
MAENDQDRQLPATERKIRKSREDGQVARSRDLGHVAALGAGVLAMAALAPTLTGWLGELLHAGLRFDAATLTQPQAMVELLARLSVHALVLVLPLGALVLAAALVAGVLSGGWNFTWKPLAPKLSKLGPLAGLRRMVSGQQLATTLKSCALALVLGVLGALYLHGALPRFAALLSQPLPAALGSAGAVVQGGLWLLLAALAAFALVDVPFQRWLLLRRLRMSHHELKKETKEVEGNLEIKQKIRARMRALATRRMLAAVPGADVVVMNPTHYAVALKYDEAAMAAPRVVAKGADLMALRIRDAARAAGVPVLEAPPLARALYAHAEVDAEIPAALFAAVAQVLAWVFQLRASMAHGRAAAPPPPMPEVPPGLDPAPRGAASEAER